MNKLSFITTLTQKEFANLHTFKFSNCSPVIYESCSMTTNHSIHRSFFIEDYRADTFVLQINNHVFFSAL